MGLFEWLFFFFPIEIPLFNNIYGANRSAVRHFLIFFNRWNLNLRMVHFKLFNLFCSKNAIPSILLEILCSDTILSYFIKNCFNEIHIIIFNVIKQQLLKIINFEKHELKKYVFLTNSSDSSLQKYIPSEWENLQILWCKKYCETIIN